MRVSGRQQVCALGAGFTCLALAAETGVGLSEGSAALAQAGSHTQGVVSLAHTLLFGCLGNRA